MQKKQVICFNLYACKQPFIFNKKIMNIFESLLEIKTAKKDLQLKAVYIPNCTASWEWTYYIYYYDAIQHTFYINDLDYPVLGQRASAMDYIEDIMTKVFRQEMNSFVDILKKIHITKKPKVFCFYRQKSTNFILIDKVSLRAKKWKCGQIISFLKSKNN